MDNTRTYLTTEKTGTVTRPVRHDVSIRLEFSEPAWGCIHVAVTDEHGTGSQRRMVMLARNFASRHYGTKVGHYVSSGYSGGAWTYVFEDPSKGTS